MSDSTVSIIMLFALTVLFCWMAGASYNAKRPWVKYLGLFIASVMAILCGTLAILALFGVIFR